MKKTAVEFLEFRYIYNIHLMDYDFQQAKEMEKQEKLTQQLFIGKVSEIIGFSKTIELLKESKQTFNK